MFRKYKANIEQHSKAMADVKVNDDFSAMVGEYEAAKDAKLRKYDVLRDLDLFVLDNSIRESTVGSLTGHTIENKWQIYNEVKKLGFKHRVVASFSHMTRVDDLFLQQLKDNGEDTDGMFAFSEITTSKRKNKVPNTENVPIGLKKMKQFGLHGAILEVDLSDVVYDFDKFPMTEMQNLMKKWIVWCHENLHKDAKVLINYRDLPDSMKDKPERIFQMTDFLGKLPADIRPFGIIFEDPTGSSLPEECGIWSRFLRQIMDNNDWKGHLLVHTHEKYGLCDATNLKALAFGCNGIWASVCCEGASMGAASSCVTITNLIRLGNKKVLKRYNCSYLRQAARNVTKITTEKEPHGRQIIYGKRALEFVYSLDKGDFDMAKFFGEENTMRITTVATPEIIRLRLVHLFGENADFTTERTTKMKEKMLEDLRNNRKEEYQSMVGLAILYDRAGGSLTEAMSEAISKMETNSLHAERLIAEIREIWDTWDLKDTVQGKVQGDDMLEFDSFYNGFMAPYFGCYRCSDTKRALQAIDMDSDGGIDWKEFMVYLKWAIHEYPKIADSEELLDVAFREGIIPAMQDEILKKQG
ncbi:uncharacterized protein LOC141912902 [Tubulanus polymorphus]|uniref:uncharacterized protein LOC141912902 n=1 Tax=Tubulanus polymorphus TaxID=672921 RepID=UPI003DA36DBC